MNNIIYDEEIITPKNDRLEYYNNFTNKLEQRDCVKFSLFCAKIGNNNSKESNLCIGLVEKWLKNEKLVIKEELWDAAYVYYIANSADSSGTYYACAAAAYYAVYVAYYVAYYATTAGAAYAACSTAYAAGAAYAAVHGINIDNINIINKYLQILLRKPKQFQNNKILEQISKVDVDKLELVDWNMITDIIQEEYNIIHGFEYEDIFSRRCLIELLRREYT